MAGGSTTITQNMNPTTGTTIVSKPTTDPNAKKCFTEWELGKKSCWTWGARKSSLSKIYCPTKSEILSADYNTIYATSTLNDGTTESNYNIFANPGGDNNKLVTRSLLSTHAARVSFVINVNHDLNLNPDDYTIQAFLSNSTNTTNICNIGASINVGGIGKRGWHDYVYSIVVRDLLYSSDDAIKRDAYICLTIGNSSWSNKRDFYLTTKYWTGSAWANKTNRTQVGNGVKTTTFNTGIKWRDMIGNRYRFVFELVKN